VVQARDAGETPIPIVAPPATPKKRTKKPDAKKHDEPKPAAAGTDFDGLPSIASISIKGDAVEILVRNTIEKTLSPLRACYRAAARAKSAAPHVSLHVGFDIDRRGTPTKVRAIGGGELDVLAPCATKVISGVNDLPGPSTGSARINVTIEFRPNL
jgi:hypothetical protein